MSSGRWDIVTPLGRVVIEAGEHFFSANLSGARFRITNADDIALLNAISTGDIILVAFTQPLPEGPEVAFTTASSIVDGLSVTLISGTVTDDVDANGNVVITATTSLGTVSTPVNTNGTWSFNLIAPAVIATQQTMNVTVVATNSVDGVGTAVRTWTVRTNQSPTVSIDTAAAHKSRVLH